MSEKPILASFAQEGIKAHLERHQGTTAVLDAHGGDGLLGGHVLARMQLSQLRRVKAQQTENGFEFRGASKAAAPGKVLQGCPMSSIGRPAGAAVAKTAAVNILRRFLLMGGWTRLTRVEAGYWSQCGAEPVDIPAVLGLDNGLWYGIREGVRGVLAPDENGVQRVYVICEPSSHDYGIMTRSAWMPVLIGERI